MACPASHQVRSCLKCLSNIASTSPSIHVYVFAVSNPIRGLEQLLWSGAHSMHFLWSPLKDSVRWLATLALATTHNWPVFVVPLAHSTLELLPLIVNGRQMSLVVGFLTVQIDCVSSSILLYSTFHTCDSVIGQHVEWVVLE